MAPQSPDRPAEPYQPSWVNRLIARFDALPLSPLVVYAGLWCAPPTIAPSQSICPVTVRVW